MGAVLNRAPSYHPAMRIRTERLILRPFRPEDEAALALEANDRRDLVGAARSLSPPLRSRRGPRVVQTQAGCAPAESLAIAPRETDRAIGGIGLERHADVVRFTAEIGYWLGTAHWGKGYAAEAVSAFVDYAFTTFDFERLEAWVFATNERSARVLEKCGFRHEGTARRSVFKEGRFLDSRLYGRLRGDSPSGAA